MNNEQDVAMGGVACAAVYMPLVIAGAPLALGPSLAVKGTCLAARGGARCSKAVVAGRTVGGSGQLQVSERDLGNELCGP